MSSITASEMGKRGNEARFGKRLSLAESKRVVRSLIKSGWTREQIQRRLNLKSHGSISLWYHAKGRAPVMLRDLLSESVPQSTQQI